MSNPAAIRQKVTEKMESALEHLKRDLAGLRTGRASVALFDGVRVDYYGTMTPLKQVANISTPEARLITIQPWEPALIKEIEKALAGSGLGVTPSNDGKIIRVPLPPLTEERRKELSKICKKHGEETKVVDPRVSARCQRRVEETAKGCQVNRRRTAKVRSRHPEAHRSVHPENRRRGQEKRTRNHGSVTSIPTLLPTYATINLAALAHNLSCITRYLASRL